MNRNAKRTSGGKYSPVSGKGAAGRFTGPGRGFNDFLIKGIYIQMVHREKIEHTPRIGRGNVPDAAGMVTKKLDIGIEFFEAAPIMISLWKKCGDKCLCCRHAQRIGATVQPGT